MNGEELKLRRPERGILCPQIRFLKCTLYGGILNYRPPIWFHVAVELVRRTAVWTVSCVFLGVHCAMNEMLYYAHPLRVKNLFFELFSVQFQLRPSFSNQGNGTARYGSLRELRGEVDVELACYVRQCLAIQFAPNWLLASL